MLQRFIALTWVRIVVAFALLAVPLFVFVELADEVRENDTLMLDERVLQSIDAVSTPMLDVFMTVITELGSVYGVLIITIGFIMLLWGRQMYRTTVLLVGGIGGAVLLNLLLKAVFQRDRPELWERIVTENSYSFPSGHAMASSALALSLIVIFWPTRWRWWAVVGGSIYMIVIGLTRLYLGVHYPTDVAAGWLVSIAWIGAVTGAIHYRRWAKSEAKQL